MNTPALPSYLQNRRSQGVAERAVSGMGGLLPPHISIRGNQFTLIDAQARLQPEGATIDVCVVDISDHMNKRYYENDWTPNSDEPPACWSSNGVGPSRESIVPQSPTCAQCQWNVRGSDVSKISNKPIKACRDEKWMAVALPKYPGMLFQLVLTPGSFKNWTTFLAPFKQGTTDVSDVVVRIGFQPQVNGVLTFQALSYIDEATCNERERALAEKATEALVGRNDVPIAGALAPPAQVQQLPPAQPPVNMGGQHVTTVLPNQLVNELPFGQAAQNGSFGANVAESPSTQGTPAFGTSSTAAPVASTTEPPKRRGRPRADQNGAVANQPAQAPFPVNQQPVQNGFGGQPAQAGFGQTTASQATPGPAFGIGQASAPDADLAAMLASLKPN